MVRRPYSLPERPQPEIHPHPDSKQAVGYAGGERRSGVHGGRSAQGIHHNGAAGYRQYSSAVYAE